MCPLYFSLRDENVLLGVDALSHPWLNVLLYVFPPLSLISPIAPGPAVTSGVGDSGEQRIFHPHPERVNLCVWPMKGCI